VVREETSMARSVRLQFFAGFRFVAVVFNKAGVRGDPLALTSIQSLPGQMLRFSKAHEVGRPPLAREFQGGRARPGARLRAIS
jgi:hypothetical protein